MTELTRWAVWLAPEDAAHASAMRLEPRVEVCVTPEGVWLRGDRSDEALENRLRRLPGARRFAVLSDGQLQAVGTIAPQGHLPTGPWQPLKDWSQPSVGEFLRNSRPVSEKSVCTLRLVRCHVPAEPTLLIVPWEEWSRYADSNVDDAGNTNWQNGRGYSWIYAIENQAWTYSTWFRPNDSVTRAQKHECHLWSHPGTFAARSRHPGGVQILLADGAVRFVRDSISITVWRNIGSKAGGEAVVAY